MDNADIATEWAERELDASLRRLRDMAQRHAAINLGLACMMCGDEIPKARRDALPGCCTCIDCQEALEQGMGR